MTRTLAALLAVVTILGASACGGTGRYVEYNPDNAPPSTAYVTPSCR